MGTNVLCKEKNYLQPHQSSTLFVWFVVQSAISELQEIGAMDNQVLLTLLLTISNRFCFVFDGPC